MKVKLVPSEDALDVDVVVRPAAVTLPLYTARMRPFFLLLAFVPVILALQANLAGLVDWHKPLLGDPLLEPSPPSIVETKAGRRILALTQKNILGALDDKGEVVWRQQLDESEPVVSYHVEGESKSSPCVSTDMILMDLSGPPPFWTVCDLCSTTISLYWPSSMGTKASYLV